MHSERHKESGENKRHSKIVITIFRVSDKRRRDLDNMQTTILDCLVKAGILDDDSIFEASCIVSTWVKVQKGHEGCDIVIL